jgi:site-specific recombinase XerD
LKLLLEHLQCAGLIPAPAPKTDDSSLRRLEHAFAQYLTQERGLAQATLTSYLLIARLFVSERFGAGPFYLAELRADDITGYVLRHAHDHSSAYAKVMVTALRALFRFLYLRGEIANDLAACVPAVANWRLTSLPKSIEAEQVEQILEHCDRETVVGQRDYAILVLLARLGLRAGEVVALTLDDIYWEIGEITIHGKGARQDRFPLPQDVGEALVIYLREGRPSCSIRRVFVRARAPHRGFSSSAAIDNIVRSALDRAGLHPPRKGAHLLRHTLATQMLRKGASLAEIGQVLRHQSPDTTTIYAKVDLQALRALAQPWPGGGL